MRVFKYECLLVICAQNGSTTDQLKIVTALKSAHPNLAELQAIVKEHTVVWNYAADPPSVPSPNEEPRYRLPGGEVVLTEKMFRMKAAYRYEKAKQPIEEKLKTSEFSAMRLAPQAVTISECHGVKEDLLNRRFMKFGPPH